MKQQGRTITFPCHDLTLWRHMLHCQAPRAQELLRKATIDPRYREVKFRTEEQASTVFQALAAMEWRNVDALTREGYREAVHPSIGYVVNVQNHRWLREPIGHGPRVRVLLAGRGWCNLFTLEGWVYIGGKCFDIKTGQEVGK